MSLFGQESSWTGSCTNPNQSPINLSQSGAKECHLTCDLVMDDGMVTQANLQNSNEGLVLTASQGYLGSCKLNGDGYNCQAIQINHPSHHTIEGVQADGEVIAYFANATGDLLCVSSLFRVHSAESPSWKFFHQFVPYADTDSALNKVSLNDWGVYQMVPPAASYFYYDGSMVIPGCATTKWIVFQQMVNMDPNDFAYLVKTTNAGSRPIKPLGDRDVFFNNSQNLAGGPIPHDNKTYIRCRPSGKKSAPKYSVSKVDLTSTEIKDSLASAEDELYPKTTLGKIKKKIGKYADANGYAETFGLFIMVIAAILGLWFGLSISGPSLLVIPKLGQRLGSAIRGIFVKKVEVPQPVV
jgi:carbonic anhydrase